MIPKMGKALHGFGFALGMGLRDASANETP